MWRRSDHLAAAEGLRVDVAVIGGGIVGAGVALDLAARGATVALVERDDFASATSSKSTKLFHGGVRYLPQLRFGLIREGLREQSVLADIADYLYLPLNFVIPLYRGMSFGDLPSILGHHRVIPAALRVGLGIYDVLGRRSERHRRIDAEETRELAPMLHGSGLRGGFVYRDAQTDDARLTIAVLKSAVERGAIALNHAEVGSIARDGPRWTLGVRDTLAGRSLAVSATSVVAAAGSFPAPSPPGTEPIAMRYSRGSHVIARAEDVGIGDNAVVLPETEDERILYMLPWQEHALIGTTDVASDGDGGYPVATKEEVDYLLRHVDRYTGLRPRPLSTFAGMRTLVASANRTSRASRKEAIVELSDGFFQVAGGKLTGYRIIAAAVADRAAAAIGLDRPSTTHTIRIAGAGGATRGSGAASGRLHLRYGSHADDVLAMAESPDAVLGDGSLRAEVVYAITAESAATIADFTLRRTRLSWFTERHGRQDAAAIAAIMASKLGWSQAEHEEQLRQFELALLRQGL